MYSLQHKWKRMKQGDKVVTNDAELDLLAKLVEGTEDADLFFGKLVSIPNPLRCGVLDSYVAWVKYSM